MLRHKLLTQCRLLSWCAFIISMHFCTFSQAQQTSPLKGGSLIELSFDEFGKIISPPAGFSLHEGSLYSFKIKVTAPKKQHDELKNYFKKGLLSLKEKLDDPLNVEAKLCSLLLGSKTELDNYKQELESLATIIGKDNQAAETDLAEKANKSDFVYLPSAKVILETLYGKTFTVGIKEQSVTDKYDKDIVITIPEATYPINETSLLVKMEDLKKRFVMDFFNQTYAGIKATIDSLKPEEFYATVLEGEIKGLSSLQTKSVEGLDAIKSSDMSVLCSSLEAYNKIKSKYYSNTFISFLSKNPKWFLSWLWYTDGEIRMNPLSFTDPARLHLQEGYDKARADNFQKYIELSMERMKDPNSELKISVAEFDSLNRKLDKGKEIYSNTAANEELKKKNKLAFSKAQQIIKVIDSISFRVTGKDEKKRYVLRTYNAANTLLPSDDSKVKALALNKEVELMVYNVRSTELLTVTPAFKDTPDESIVMTQLNQIGELGTDLLTQAATAGPIVASLTKSYSNANNLVRLQLTPDSLKSVGSPIIKNVKSLKTNVDYTVSFIVQETPLVVKLLITNGGKNVEEYDFLEEVEKQLKASNVDCQEVFDVVRRGLFSKLKSSGYIKTLTVAEYTIEIAHLRNEINKFTTEIINVYAKKLHTDLTTEFPLLILAGALLESKAYILPPKTIKIENDPSSPGYSNFYTPVAMQETSKKVTLPFVLTDKADGRVIAKRTDFYKVSQPRYVMASLGVSYVFEKFRRNEAEVKEGKIVNVPDEDQARLVGGFHIYPNPILLTDNRFIGCMGPWAWTSRLSVFVGASFPKPLYNPQFGISMDPWPGVKFTYGLHYYKKTSQRIVNDQIQDEETKYLYNSPFVSLSIEPVSFVKLIGLIK